MPTFPTYKPKHLSYRHQMKIAAWWGWLIWKVIWMEDVVYILLVMPQRQLRQPFHDISPREAEKSKFNKWHSLLITFFFFFLNSHFSCNFFTEILNKYLSASMKWIIVNMLQENCIVLTLAIKISRTPTVNTL